ncbi:hypothetical protein G9A89_021529 [Geosiphon pyriformis]|nr:hypothetical protein G9A89_021529 [Geosiphon pyriformis]
MPSQKEKKKSKKKIKHVERADHDATVSNKSYLVEEKNEVRKKRKLQEQEDVDGLSGGSKKSKIKDGKLPLDDPSSIENPKVVNVGKSFQSQKDYSEIESSKKKENTIEIQEKKKANREIETAKEEKPKKKRESEEANKQTYYQRHQIEVIGDRNFDPTESFDQLNVDEDIKSVLHKYQKPTPIQAGCWPVCLSGRNVIGIAETGSGKTLAFIIPALVHVKQQLQTSQHNRAPVVLVVAPTRELAMQTQEQCQAFSQSCGVTSLCVYGGVRKEQQRKALKKGVNILVATPGRLLDLIEEKFCDISNVSYLVLDEADRMLDIGFEDAIRKIILQTSQGRQTLMFSATWPDSVRKLANDFLDNPIKINIGSPDLAANNNVTQIVEVLDPKSKDRRLSQLLQDYHSSRKNRVLVFALYKKEATRIEEMLSRQGYQVKGIHGDKNQHQRIETLESFKEGTYPLMVATDVAARGLDIPNVEYVINYTFPLTIEDYVHRIGRTGRAGNKGISHTFFTLHDKSHSGALINILKQAKQKIPEDLLKFGGTVKKKEHKVYGAFYKDIDPSIKPTKIVFNN